jgi:hypothetical protein
VKKITLTILFFLALNVCSFGQNTASFGTSFIHYQPLFSFKELPYDVGYGAKLDFVSKKYSLTKSFDYQFGGHVDFGAMGRKNFSVSLDLPNPDNGTVSSRNSTYGLFGKVRFIPSYDGNFKPYVELFLGHRNFNTRQIVIANTPSLNPQYESQSTFDRVVFTQRFNVGAGFGFRYRTSQKLAIETSLIYHTSVTKGAVQPLNQVENINGYIQYNHEISYTPILLVNLGLRFYFNEKSEYDPNQRRPTNTQRRETNRRPTTTRPAPKRDSKEPLKTGGKTKPPKLNKPKS